MSCGGARLSSFLVVATAKQVLEKNDPGLLAENGGDIELTSTWAKSFLKRVRSEIRKNKSVQAGAGKEGKQGDGQ